MYKGQFFFAWIDEDEDFDPAVHDRMDEWVFSANVAQQEGDFAAMSLSIRNPRIGLLNPARKIWAYFSVFDGEEIVPLMKGRLIGVPTNVFDTIVQIDFIAKPSDFVAQKIALAATLKVAPFWDPIFVDPSSWDDPDVVLEAYSKLWFIDPVTHEVLTTDILIDDVGNEEIFEHQHFYDGMQLTLDNTPLRRVTVIATIPWTQSDFGNVDITSQLMIHWSGGYPNICTSFTMNGMISDWPKTGATFGSGWKVGIGTLQDVSSAIPVIEIPEIFSWQGVVPILPRGSIAFPLYVTGEYHSGEKAGFNFQFELIIAALGYAVPRLVLNYVADREFGQVISFTLETDQQSIVTDPGEDEAMVITLNANKVSDSTEDDTVPLGDLRRRQFAHTPRGQQAIEHLLLLARANLIARSRCVTTTAVMDFLGALRCCNLRKSALIHDPRLPGGEAAGKITKWELTADGDSGEFVCNVTIASAVGRGGSHVPNDGDPTYVEDDYVEIDYQERSGAVLLLDTEDIAYTYPLQENFDDGIDFEAGLNANNAILTMSLTNSAPEQGALLQPLEIEPLNDQAKVQTILEAHPTQFHVQMVPMEGGPFQQEVVISVSDLVIPKQIDLEAASNG